MKNNLKELRTQAGLTLEHFSIMSGVTVSALSRMETGKQPGLSLETAYRIAAALNKDVTEVWPNTTEMVTETITLRRVKPGEPKKPRKTKASLR